MNRIGARQLSRPFNAFRGFTIQEMLVTLCISGTLAGGGAGMWHAVQQNAITVAANDLVTHLALARSEAITKNLRITVCPTENQSTCAQPDSDHTSWQKGWMIYADKNDNGHPDSDEIIRVQSGVSGGVLVNSSQARRRIVFQPTGMSGGSTITIAICGARDAAMSRYVIVSNTGRARVAQTTTSNMKCG